jgi:hypothetical protein
MKVAVIATIWHPLSHADVMVSRWVAPFFTDPPPGRARPRSEIASVYLEQITERDIGRAFCARHGIPIFDSIEKALTMDGKELAVDAVLLIAEHGEYPLNEFGQKLYPRKAFFDAITGVFRETGRAVPVFNDKHLSWDFDEARAMVATADELGFPLFAGSSLPYCALEPGRPLADGEKAEEALVLFQGGAEGYGFHAIEFLLSLVGRRAGGERGIRAVRVLEGTAVRGAMKDGEMSPALLRAALLQRGYPDAAELVEFVLERAEGLLAYQFEHCDGFRATNLLMPKFVSGWTAAIRNSRGETQTCLVKLEGAKNFFGNFACLNQRIEEFFHTGAPPAPAQRNCLAAGALQAALQARKISPGRWRRTPHLEGLYGS